MEGADSIETFKERLRFKLPTKDSSSANGNGDDASGERAPKQCNQLLVMENVDSLLPLKQEISSNIINFISIYNELKILMISRAPINKEDYN